MFSHTASFGDGCQVAPDGDRIEPKIEPISEEIKYKLFHFMIEEGDLAVADGDALTRIQVRHNASACSPPSLVFTSNSPYIRCPF